MSILIKNMAMPKNCTDCPCLDTQNGICQANANKKYVYSNKPSWCPLVEVKPHGRLIDADAWIAKVREELLSPNCKKGALEIMGAMFRDVLDAPTIVEAETCNETCNKLQDSCNDAEDDAVNASIGSEE